MRRRKDRLICKLDIEKAYDHLNWEFILNVMKRMSIGVTWMEWIKWCIFTTSFSILINDTFVGFFLELKGFEIGGSPLPV